MAGAIAALTYAECAVYKSSRFSTYFAVDALITVFTDGLECLFLSLPIRPAGKQLTNSAARTERAPTFRLLPLDTVQAGTRKSWFQVWTAGVDGAEAWETFLGRKFRGLVCCFSVWLCFLLL